jgi:hypothetical protein
MPDRPISSERCSLSVPIAADVTGVQELALVVTPGGDGNAFDHADWGNAGLACQ